MLDLRAFFQEAAESVPRKVGLFEAAFGEFGPEDALAMLWLVLAVVGVVAALATILSDRWSLPPKVLHFLIGAGVVGLALRISLAGVPPARWSLVTESGQPAYPFQQAVLHMASLSVWLALVAACGFALAFPAVRQRRWWRLTGCLLLIGPLLTLRFTGLGQAFDPSLGPLTEEDLVVIAASFRKAYLSCCASLPAAAFLFLVFHQIQRRREAQHDVDAA